MNNWKTTAFGVATAVLGFIAFSPQYFPPVLVDLAKYAAIGGLAGLGLAAGDAQKK
jgi:hypothetical protein